MKVAVIGAGVMGMSCAWRLARAGVEVVLLDAGKVGEGATLAALGALWPASPLVRGALQELHRESLWAFEPFLEEVKGVSGRAVSFRRLGRVELLNSAKAVVRAEAEAAYARAHWPAFGGTVMEVISGTEVGRLYPALGSGEAGLICRATAQVRVGELVAALRAGCERMGVAIHEQIKVSGFDDRGGRIVAVRCGVQRFNADAVVLTTGAWTSLLEGIALPAIRPVKGQGIALSIPAGLDGLSRIVKRGAIYLMPWDEEILVGATTEAEAGFDETVTDVAREALFEGACAIVPALRGSRVVRQWAGLRPQNPVKPHWPVMGRHGAFGNLFLCVGHFKTGIGMAPRVSELMAEMVMTGRGPGVLEPFAPNT